MLERSLTYLLSSIAEDGIGSANHIFEVRFGWSVRELRVLRLVRSTPGVTFTALATMTKFERSLTSRILTKLIKAGLISRSNNPQDARQFTLSVTVQGEALCAAADPLTSDLEALMLMPLASDERAALLSSLDRMRAWVQGDYAVKVAERFPEMRNGTARRGSARSVEHAD